MHNIMFIHVSKWTRMLKVAKNIMRQKVKQHVKIHRTHKKVG